jgi:hypothetical protein
MSDLDINIPAFQSMAAYLGRCLWQNPEANVLLKKAHLKIPAVSQ